MRVQITIEITGGQWLINGKRLGYDDLTEAELLLLNEFFKEIKLKN